MNFPDIHFKLLGSWNANKETQPKNDILRECEQIRPIVLEIMCAYKYTYMGLFLHMKCV